MPIYGIFAALVVAMCWGGNYSATKFALMDLPPIFALAVRFVMVSIVVAPFALRHGRPRLRAMLFISMTLIVIQFALVFSAMNMGLSIASVIIGSQLGVPFACVMAAMFMNDPLGRWRSFGLMVAFIGVMIVAGTPNAAAHWVPFLMAVVGSFSWAVANLYLKQLKPSPPMSVLLFWPALFAILPLFALSVLFESPTLAMVEAARLPSWLGIVYSCFFSSILGYGLWNWLITRFPVSQVMPFGLVMPLFGIGVGMLIFGEAVTPQILVGGALTIAGVGIITLRRPKLVQMEQ